MHPDIISIGPLSIHAYGVMMALGFLAGLGNWILLGRREGHSTQFCTDLMFWIMVSGIVGARTAYVLENWTVYAADPQSIIRLDQGGLIFYGGFVAAAGAVVFFARRHKVPLPRLFDFVVTSVPLAHALGRIGCFLNGCCFGSCTAAVPHVQFPRNSIPWLSQLRGELIDSNAAWSLPVHPVQLYEAAFNFLCFGLIVWLYRRKLRPGIVSGVYLVLYAIGRFSLEFMRGDRGDRMAVQQLSIGQFISLLVLLAGIVVLAVLGFTHPEKNHSIKS
jgi:phosphatidylglycerol:prolipoprotein diacylglycerol transferase